MPDGAVEKYTYGVQYAANEGKLLQTQYLTSGGALLRTTNAEYQLTAAGQAYPAAVATSPQQYANPTAGTPQPAKKNETVQQGMRFTWQVDANCGGGSTLCFDQFARPTKVTKSSAPSP